MVVGLILFDRFLMPYVVRLGDEVDTPNVVLLSEEEADSLLAQTGLKCQVLARRYDNQVPPGRIMDQEPGPGMRVKRGRILRLLVSLGSLGRSVPEIRGHPVSHAQLLLGREGMAMGRVTYVTSREVPEQTVVAASPAPGAPFPAGGEVNLLVSEGYPKRAFLMRDFRGESAERIRSLLKAAGLQVEVRAWPGQPLDADEIVEQTPPSGHRIEEGGMVELLTGRRKG